jgi:hypothetical protein
MSKARDKANIPSLNFSSTGIDDNATSTAITINSSQHVELHGGQIESNNNTSSITYSGGDNSNAGANLTLFGGSHATTPNVARFRSSATEVMRITSSGNVGIGTSSPTGRLHLKNSSTFVTQKFASSVGDAANIAAYRASPASLALYLACNRDTSTGVFADTNAAASGIILYGQSNNGYMLFTTSSANNTVPAERMRIDSSGNVGIGRNSPSEKLDVNGDIANKNGIMYTLYQANLVSNLTTGTNFIGNGTNNRGLILVKNTTAGHYSNIPFYGRGGGGVAWRVQWLDPDSGWTTSESFSFAENGTSANTYTVSWNTGTGGISFTRTAGSASYDVKIFWLPVSYT